MASKDSTLTQAELKELLHYEPETGEFVWICEAYNLKGKIAGWIEERGYPCISINGKDYKAHRLAFLYMDGVFPPEQVDHINHNRTDNRWINIRHATCSENSKNCSIRKDNISGVVGVNRYKALNKWVSQIQVNNKKIHLGFFDDFFEAVCARKSAENKYGFHKNHGNII